MTTQKKDRMPEEFGVKTSKGIELVEITAEVQQALSRSKIQSGLCVVYCPHTTAGITINENADPDVRHDLERAFAESVPKVSFRHSEGNSHSHYLSAMVGQSATLLVDNGELVLGRWQGIYFCEFDGPRSRRVHVAILAVPRA